MFCRTCGNKMNDNAEICVKCGVRKNVGSDYCQVCGGKTTATMTTCPKCHARLIKALSTNQIKKKTVSGGRKAISVILLIIGIGLMMGAVINFYVGITSLDYYRYEAASSIGAGGRCLIIGIVFLIISSRLKKK